MKIGVAHIVEDMKIGGQERVIQSIIESIDKTKFTPYVLCLSRGGAVADYLRNKGYAIDVLNIGNYNSFKSIFTVVKWLKDNNIDIVHTHAHPAGYLGRVAAIFAGGIHIVHHIHTVPIDFTWKQHLKDSILGLFTDRVICISYAVKNYILKHERFISKKTEVIYNGITDVKVEEGIIEFLKANLKIDRDVPIIGAVASFTENKGHKYLFEAFAIVLKDIPSALLILVGDGLLRPYLEKTAEELEIKENIIFCGIQDDIFPFVAIFDILVQPSVYREGLGRTIIEAMILSKPVVASRLHGIVEVVEDGKSGFLVPPGDSDAIADAILKLIRDRKLAEAMGKRGREIYLEKFTLERMVRKIEDIYGKIAMRRNQ